MDSFYLMLIVYSSLMLLSVMIGILFRTKFCPQCKAKLPFFVIPFSKNWIFGAVICPECKKIINYKGKIITDIAVHNNEFRNVKRFIIITSIAFVVAYILLIVFMLFLKHKINLAY